MAVSAVVSAVASAVGEAVAWSIAATSAISTFTFAVIETVVSLAVGSLLSSAFGGKESGSSTPNFTVEARDRTQVVRSSVANRHMVYGETIISGPLVFAETTGADNKYLHLVVPLANHECESIGTVYLGDQAITDAMMTSSGIVIHGNYANGATSTCTASASGNTYTFGADDFFVESGTKIYVTGMSNPANNGEKTVVSASYDGVPTVITVSESLVDESGTANFYRPAVRIKKHLGSSTQTADADLVAEINNTTKWGWSHRLQGIAYLYVRLRYDRDDFPFGIPNIKAVVKGKKVFDPRTSTTAWSDNLALCVYDYVTSEYGLNAAADEINSQSFEDAADICDQNVQVTVSTTQKRYTCNGAVNLGNRPLDILTELMTAGVGAVVYTQGEYKLYVGAADTATPTLDESYLRGAISVRTRKARKDLFNSIRGTYLSSSNYWQPTDFPEITNSTYVTEDGGEKIYRDIQLPFTDDIMAAQRIAKIHLERSRQGITVEMPCNFKALELKPYDVIKLTMAKFGWTEKEFRIVNWKINQDGGVDLTLQEESSSSYDWNYGEATVVDPAPDTNLPNPWDVEAPTALSAESGTDHLLISSDGTIISRVKLSWSEPDDSFIYNYEVEYKKSTSSNWLIANTVKYKNTETFISPVEDGVAYDFRIRSINLVGVKSDWLAISNHVVIGKTAAPDNVTGFDAEFVETGIRLSWEENTDVDLYGYEIREGTNWETDQVITTITGTSYLHKLVLSGTYDFEIKALDTSGNYSATEATKQVVVSSPSSPVITSSFNNAEVIIEWSATAGTFPISHYELRDGSDNLIAKTNATSFRELASFSSKTYKVTAYDIAGNSSGQSTDSVVVTDPSVASITSQVIDNNVLLYFSGNAGTLPIAEFELRKGTTFATADVIGTKRGTFTVIFESLGGDFTYWVVPIDTAGNYGTEQSLLVTVNDAPDYVLRENWTSDFGGTKSSVIERITGDLLAPVKTNETWAQHFSNNSWLTIQDQITAGYPIFAEPAATSGYYEETFDYGTVISSTKITLTQTAQSIDGTVTVTPKISVSDDNISYTDYNDVWQVVASNFRYVKIRLTYASTGGDDLLNVSSINVRLDIKLRNDAGSGTASTGGTTVDFNVSFIDVDAIIVTPKFTPTNADSFFPVVEFNDAANPTSFKVFIYDETGTDVGGAFTWTARGY